MVASSLPRRCATRARIRSAVTSTDPASVTPRVSRMARRAACTAASGSFSNDSVAAYAASCSMTDTPP